MRSHIPECLSGRPDRPLRRPLDEQDVAVRLEAAGITDGVAQTDWGYATTWELANDCYHSLAGSDEPFPPLARRSALALHLHGMFFALPLVLCCLAMILLKFSLWGGDVPGDVAAAVAAGTVSSFIVTGGIVQAMARQTLFYSGTGEFRMSEVVCWRWYGYGAVTLAATAMLGCGLNSLFAWFPHPLGLTAAGFHLALGLFWLGTGGLYILERSLWVSGVAATGILVVTSLHLGFNLTLVTAQLTGILIAAAIASVAVAYFLRARARADHGRVHRLMPLRTLYLTAPYITYGCLYYLFLFTDRLLAWTAQTGSSALPLVFRGDYEFPLDLALFAFVVQVGWVHSSTVRFYEHLQARQRICDIAEPADFNRQMQSFYAVRVGRFLIPALGISIAFWAAAWTQGFINGAAARIAFSGLAAYPFLVVGLWNVSLLFALSLPKAAVAAIALGVGCDLAVGYPLSRLISYDWAVAGFTCGALVFAMFSSIIVLLRFKHLDYFYFASAA